MTQSGQISITVEGENFLLKAEAPDGQKVEINLPAAQLEQLSLAFARILSDRHSQLKPDAPQRPMLDIVSPDVSFTSTKMGVEMTVSGHGIAPIRLTFPLVKALPVARGFVEEAEKVADSMGLPPE
ncbi:MULTISPECIES: hypothetical protein [Agrobacterium tumefaciens complex]|uniref:hypothetical protein n=1 Tax=Agrobacterium tumefaciens complex TaxID=1183400 RepID=UPI000EF4DD56|nr:MULTISPECIES: hypothetical protein [Agrobacterium tumefaciens complex]AYM56393.1 hypothetical protein At1D132_03760 [Agrobacterium fabrum]NSZ10768.1 hypothetical protein [Agrobacterium fabrum]